MKRMAKQWPLGAHSAITGSAKQWPLGWYSVITRSARTSPPFLWGSKVHLDSRSLLNTSGFTPVDLRQWIYASGFTPLVLGPPIYASGVWSADLLGGFTPADSGFEEAIYVAIEDSGRITHFEISAEILHHLIGSQYIGAHLVTP